MTVAPLVKPKYDVNAIYPQAKNIHAASETTEIPNTAANQAKIVFEDAKTARIGKIVTFIGVLTVAVSVLSLLQSVASLFSGNPKSLVSIIPSAVLSLLFVKLGLGIIRREESSRMWYVILSLVGILMLVPSMTALTLTSLSSHSPSTDTMIQQERNKLSSQRRIQSEQEQIRSYNTRIDSLQSNIDEYQRKNDNGQLTNNIRRMEDDIARTKLDIQQAQLNIQEIEQQAKQKTTQATTEIWSPKSLVYIYASTIANLVVYILALIFLTRKSVKNIFH